MVLTAYNEDVQAYIHGTLLERKKKIEFIEKLKEKVSKKGLCFSKLFAGKKYNVLDEIMHLIASKGIWKIGVKRLAERCDCSESTVKNAVRSIKDTGEILVCRIANNQAGKYIFVLKSHPNFKEILRKVFYLSENEINSLVKPPVKPLENRETVGAVEENGENPSSNHSNFNSLKQERDNKAIRESIEQDILESKDKKQEMERVLIYCTNDFQKDLYFEFKKSHYHTKIRESISIMALRLGSNCTQERYFSAVTVLNKMNRSFNSGLQIEKSAPALFAMMIETEMLKQSAQPVEEKQSVKPVPFYNWLAN